MAKTLPHVDPTNILRMVSDAYLVRIGRVVTQWSAMEAVLESAIWQATGVRGDVGRALTSQTQVQGKLDLLASVLRQTRPALGEQAFTLATYVKDCLGGKRNLIAHGLWVDASDVFSRKEDAPHRVVKFSARGRLTDQSVGFSTDELETFAKEIAEVTSWLIDLCALLPKLRQQPGALNRTTPKTQNPRDCANLRLRALQPPTLRPKAPKPSHQQRNAAFARHR
jgi:hypothetical protein